MPILQTFVTFQVEGTNNAERIVDLLEAAGFDPVRAFPAGPDAEAERRDWIGAQMQRRFGFSRGMPGLVLHELLRLGIDGLDMLEGVPRDAIARRLATTPTQVEAAVFILLHATADERAARGFALTGFDAEFPGADIRHLLALAEAISPSPAAEPEDFECPRCDERDDQAAEHRHGALS
jgi:hypothetical protein